MKRILLAAFAATLAAPLAQAFTSAGVRIDAPVISVESLTPDTAPWYVEGGPVVQTFLEYLQPAPVHWDYFGEAELMLDADDAVAARTLAPASAFVIVGDRYAPSLTFTAGAHSRVTVQAAYTFETAIENESFDGSNPPEAFAGFELLLVAIADVAFDEQILDYSYELLSVSVDSASLSADATQRSGTRSGVLSASFDNPGDGDAVFAFRGQMVAWGRSAEAQTSPVPEPSSAWLLLAGLGLTAAVVRGRRRVAA